MYAKTERINYKDFDYKYLQSSIKFQISQVCLEGNYWDSGKEMFPKIYNALMKSILGIEKE
jgi:hypothetical protein